jgi:NAD(P)-dependent dehydrogenase (short-subunit alcohol dehydrogenase family)/acyl carrier protein
LYDLDPDADQLDQARRLVDELLDPGQEDQIALRGAKRYQARLRQAEDLCLPFPVQTREDGSYLVTGGFGALGLLVAEFLVDHGARDVVLMSRTPPPDRQSWEQIAETDPFHATVRTLASLEARGVRLTTAAVDVTDHQQLTDWLEEHQASGAPPIVGVVNVAGVVDDELLIRMSEEKFTRVLRPKLLGGWNLHRLFVDTALDFFVMFSSAGSVITSPGQGNYAAGNAFLDALAHYRHGLGLPAMSIGWGPWSIGMVQELELEQQFQRRGIELITPTRGKQILGRLLHQRAPHVIAMAADWATAREAAFGRTAPAMYSDLVSDGQQGPKAEVDGATLDALRELEEPERQQFLTEHIRLNLATVLGLEVAEVDVDLTLNQLGMDSIMAIEMKSRIDATLQVDLPVLDLLQGPTVSSLAADIALKIDLASSEIETPQSVSEHDTASPTAHGPEIDELEALIAALPQAEVESMLRDLETQAASSHE